MPLEQLALAHHPVGVLNKMQQQFEHTRLDRYSVAGQGQSGAFPTCSMNATVSARVSARKPNRGASAATMRP